MHTYLIQLAGQVNVSELNTLSPHQMTAIRARPAATRFTVCTDQSGLLGLMRYLHNCGLVFLAVRQVG